MNSRIYLQPDALPTQDEIRTANRLFRHFGKEVTFLQQQEADFPDITMNRLRWALMKPKESLKEAAHRSGNVVADLSNFPADKARLTEEFEGLEEATNLVIIDAKEIVIELKKEK